MGGFKFLVIDHNPDGRALLIRTLVRKFPEADIIESRDAAHAVATAASVQLNAIITHRTEETDGVAMIRLLRQANAEVPILMVSGTDRSEEALSAGATRFLHYDEWLRAGTVVADLIQQPASATPWPASL
jgi:CheY-like chemotaxis protein